MSEVPGKARVHIAIERALDLEHLLEQDSGFISISSGEPSHAKNNEASSYGSRSYVIKEKKGRTSRITLIWQIELVGTSCYLWLDSLGGGWNTRRKIMEKVIATVKQDLPKTTSESATVREQELFSCFIIWEP